MPIRYTFSGHIHWPPHATTDGRAILNHLESQGFDNVEVDTSTLRYGNMLRIRACGSFRDGSHMIGHINEQVSLIATGAYIIHTEALAMIPNAPGKPDKMQLYVWRGPNTLRNYNSGIVVIAARDIEEAWDKLKKEDFWVYMRLKTQVSHYWSEECVDCADEDERATWKETPHEVFSLENLPVLYLTGGE